jgi:4-alpha-glucanotransferase
MASVAKLCIIPAQDLLGLGDAARFNRPGEAAGNWRWRLAPDQLNPALGERLYELTWAYHRLIDPSRAEPPLPT